jgi:hypothetical protein
MAYEHEADEWRMAVRDMPETERLASAMDVRTSQGLSAYDGDDQ